MLTKLQPPPIQPLTPPLQRLKNHVTMKLLHPKPRLKLYSTHQKPPTGNHHDYGNWKSPNSKLSTGLQKTTGNQATTEASQMTLKDPPENQPTQKVAREETAKASTNNSAELQAQEEPTQKESTKLSPKEWQQHQSGQLHGEKIIFYIRNVQLTTYISYITTYDSYVGIITLSMQLCEFFLHSNV